MNKKLNNLEFTKLIKYSMQFILKFKQRKKTKQATMDTDP